MNTEPESIATSQNDSITVIVRNDSSRRGDGANFYSAKNVKIQDLSANVNIFLGQMKNVIDAVPVEANGFTFDEIEVSVEISATGKLNILGTGVEGSAGGGFKFIFRRK